MNALDKSREETRSMSRDEKMKYLTDQIDAIIETQTPDENDRFVEGLGEHVGEILRKRIEH